MRRREFNQTLTGVGGVLLSAVGCSQDTGSTARKQAIQSQAGNATEAQMLQDARNALPYRKPKGLRNGSDGLDRHQVLQVTRRPAEDKVFLMYMRGGPLFGIAEQKRGEQHQVLRIYPLKWFYK
jgi:hypothetical protein